MSNPLSHVGQTARPEFSPQVDRHCEQAQPSSKETRRSLSLKASPNSGTAPRRGGRPRRIARSIPSSRNTRKRPDGQQRILQQGETRAEDNTLPAPSEDH